VHFKNKMNQDTYSVMPNKNNCSPHVGLFITCLIDLFRPSIAWATIDLLKQAGCKVTVPQTQTCCGQPAYNSGANIQARDLAKKLIDEFKEFDFIVVPSGSCSGMIKQHFLELFKDDVSWLKKATLISRKTYELTEFLIDVLDFKHVHKGPRYCYKVTYHDSCSGLRESNIKDQPRKLLKQIDGLNLIEGKEAETCCGFGGLFCMKYPEISEKIVDLKVDDILSTKTELLLGGDLGCLMNIAGRISRRGERVDVRHVAEYLAGSINKPPI